MTYNSIIGVADQLVNIDEETKKKKINFGQIWEPK